MLTLVANVCCVVASVIGVFAALTFTTLVLAGSANSNQYQQVRFRFMVLTTLIVTVVSVVGAIWAMSSGKPWLGASVGLMPVVVSVVLIAWASIIKL